MSNLPVNPNLELLLPENKPWDFYVYDLTLKEGISQLPIGIVNLYSQDFMDMEELSDYLDVHATVKITQQHNKENVSRCFSGIITNVEHLGLLQENENGTTYGFRMTIQPSLVNLYYARHNYSFKDYTPVDAIKTILENYDYNMDELDEENTPGLNTPSSFYQGKENDFQFLMRILETYGINFCFHSEFTEDAPKAPIMYLNPSGIFSISAEISPEVDFDFPLAFHCRNRDKNHYAMTQWKLGNRIGVDAAKVDFQAANDQSLSYLAGDSQAERIFCYNSSPFGMIQQNDLEQKTNSFLGKLNLAKHNWQGTTGSLVAMPGVAIDVLEFYGKKNNADIPALILYTELFCRAPMPNTLVQSDNALPATCEIKLNCINRTMPAEQAASVTELQQESKQNTTIAAAAGAVGDKSTSTTEVVTTATNNGTQLLQAIVCDATGKTSAKNSTSILSENNQQENRYTFTAKLLSGDNTSTPVDVWLVMPLGGFGQGLFRVPRQGEYILVAQNAGTNEYYLMGYLPNGNMPFASKANYSSEIDPDTGETNTLNSSTVLRFSQTNANSNVPSYLGDDNSILPKRVGMHSGGKPAFSEIGFYTTYGSSTSSSNTTAYNAETDNGEATPPMYNDEAAREIKENLNIQAPDMLSLTAGDSVSANSPSVSFSGQVNGSCSTSELTIAQFNTIKVSAESTIAFQVGSSSIIITRDSIILNAARWCASPGPLTSSIVMSAMSGVVISGMNTMVSGAYSLSLSDGSGDSIKMGTGVITQTAAAIRHNTLSKQNYTLQNSLTGAYIGLEYIGFIVASTNNKGVHTCENVTKFIRSGATMITQIIGCVLGAKQFYNEMKGHHGRATDFRNLNIASLVFNIVGALMEQILFIINTANPAWLNKPTSKNGFVTNRDAFRLTCMSLYTIGWILGVIAGSFLPKLTVATFNVEGNTLDIWVRNKNEVTQEEEEAETLIKNIAMEGAPKNEAKGDDLKKNEPIDLDKTIDNPPESGGGKIIDLD